MMQPKLRTLQDNSVSRVFPRSFSDRNPFQTNESSTVTKHYCCGLDALNCTSTAAAIIIVVVVVVNKSTRVDKYWVETKQIDVKTRKMIHKYITFYQARQQGIENAPLLCLQSAACLF